MVGGVVTFVGSGVPCGGGVVLGGGVVPGGGGGGGGAVPGGSGGPTVCGPITTVVTWPPEVELLGDAPAEWTAAEPFRVERIWFA